MSAVVTNGAQRLPQAFIERLQDFAGDRLQLSDAIRLEHGRSETHFAPMPPDAVVFADSTEDVVKTVKLCAEFGVPIVPFGAGTSVEGNALAVNGGVSLDLSRMTVYNYNVPASLKAWIDHIVRKGLTLGFDGEGLVTGKTATILLASGGIYTEGSPIRDRDIATLYLRLILNVLGITDVTFVAGGGAKAVDLGDETMDDFVARHLPDIGLAAAA